MKVNGAPPCFIAFKLLGLIFVLSYSSLAWTNEPTQGADCSKLIQPQDVLNCALIQDPLIKQAEARALQSTTLSEVAHQRPNPELDSNTAFGSSEGEKVINSQITLFHTFELGGKRSSRVEKAHAELEVTSTEILRAKEEVALKTVSTLYRLRQIRTEREALNEALSTFTRIANILKPRPKLTPDQEVALITFNLAQSDHRLQIRALNGEENILLKSLELSLGRPFQIVPELLPQMKEKWPKVIEAPDVKILAGSTIHRLRAEIKASGADLSLEQSKAWPNLRIGPTFQSQTQAGLSYVAYGFGLSLPLPLYHRNEGGKAYAAAGITRSEIALEATRKQLLAELYKERAQYQASVQAMEESLTLRQVEKSHNRIERLFRSGLIQPALVIEGHRQIMELTKNLNTHELSAIKALWKIYILQGRAMTERL